MPIFHGKVPRLAVSTVARIGDQEVEEEELEDDAVDLVIDALMKMVEDLIQHINV